MKTYLSPLARKLVPVMPLCAALALVFATAAPAADAPAPAEGSPSAAASAPAGEPAASAAQPAASTAQPAVEAQATASAMPAVPASPSIADWVPPEARSEQPKPEEWEKAAPLELVRSHKTCTASALREWIRISCLDDTEDHFMGARVVGGSDEGVQLGEFEVKPKDKDSVKKHGAHVMFPVRRGDRRVIALHSWESGGWKSFYIVEDTALVISELWLPGDRAPTITVH